MAVTSLIWAAVAVAGLPAAAAVAAAPRDAASLAIDSQEQRLVRREQMAAPSTAALSEAAVRGVPEAPNEIIDRILDGTVNGSTLVGDETLGEKVFWLEAGCRSLMPDPVMAGKFASVNEKAGRIQCCRDEPHNNGTFCYRKHGNVCLSTNTSELATFSAAAIACETNGYRLCTKQELLEESAEGCCRSGCGIDDALVWTSTFSFKGLKDSNEVLKAEIENVKADNLRIEAEHKELESKMGELESVVNDTKIPDGYVPPPPEDTLRKAPIHTITGEEAEALAKENSRLWYEVEAMRRENDDLKDHIVAIVNGTIVNAQAGRHVVQEEAPLPASVDGASTDAASAQSTDAAATADAPAQQQDTQQDTVIDALSDDKADAQANRTGYVAYSYNANRGGGRPVSVASTNTQETTALPGEVKVGAQVVHNTAARAVGACALAAMLLALTA